MIDKLDINTVVGFVFSHNDPGIRPFKSFGFEEWGELPDVTEMDGRECSLSIVGLRMVAARRNISLPGWAVMIYWRVQNSPGSILYTLQKIETVQPVNH